MAKAQKNDQAGRGRSQQNLGYVNRVALHGKIRPPSPALIRQLRMGKAQDTFLPVEEEILLWDRLP